MKKILINENPWQTRIAITANNQLQNIYFSGHAQETLERIFFKGIVTKVLPGIQTAFVDIGQKKAGFLHISEIDRELAIENISKYSQLDEEQETPPQQKPKQRKQLNISTILHEKQEILVQVSKEPVYEKGAKLTTCFTLPGRFLVLMPNIPRIGISKKIEDKEERQRLKNIVKQALPEGMGGIIRTTSLDQKEEDIKKDISYLLDTWNYIQKKFQTAEPKEKLYQDLDLVLQIVRDHLDHDVEEVITDNKKTQTDVYQFVKKMAPEFSQKIKLYSGTAPLFEAYDIEKQILAALEKKVSLKSGGSLIIETTEAMTVIDVNTGKFTGKSNLEETILKTNLEAAQEIAARQLRLRNIGGLIVIDFIDMSSAANKQKLFKFFEKTLRETDKFQSVVLKISEFGLVQMTRKRSGKSLIQQIMIPCTTCKGNGHIFSLQTECYAILRAVKERVHEFKAGTNCTLSLHPNMFEYLSHVEYNSILTIEKLFQGKITLVSDQTIALNDYKLEKN